MKKVELLIPASSLEVLKVAVMFGADAVYIGGEAFSLRAKAKNFSMDEMAEGIEFAHAHGVKVYVTANILAHNEDLANARTYFRELKKIGPDALIISDPGIFMIAKEELPQMELHVSTQANNTNYGTYLFWMAQGAKRVVTGRELSLKEIREIRANIPEDLEIETFVHGAMCISYSGRCLLSNYMAGRDANQGACTHPCRWKYKVIDHEATALREDDKRDSKEGINEQAGVTGETVGYRYSVEEESRPGEQMPVYENERGTYIFNSKDLCMIEHVPDLLESGIDSLKIEGRMKTALYVATVARTYRKAIDDYMKSPELYEANMEWYREEIGKCTYREFTTGFFYGKPDHDTQIYDANTYVKNYTYLGIAMTTDACMEGFFELEQRNKFSVGEEIEIMRCDGSNHLVTVQALLDEDGNALESAPHPKQRLFCKLSKPVKDYDILRRRED